MLSSHPLLNIGENPIQLAIETSGQTGSLALFRGTELLRQVQLDAQKRTASSIAPTLSEWLIWCESEGLSLQFVSVANGPGSFTGLRIGVTTAKTLCYARGLPLVAVDSVAAVAATAFWEHADLERVLVGLNAFRGQVFAGDFARTELHVAENISEICQQRTNVLDAAEWTSLRSRVESESLSYTGDAKVLSGLPPTGMIRRSAADAVGVGVLGLMAAEQNLFCEPLALTPRYLKQSAAEEKLGS